MTMEETIGKELEKKGWTRQNVYSGERLNDIITAYKETGFQVITLSAGKCDMGCDACFDPSLMVIYTRPKKEGALEDIF